MLFVSEHPLVRHKVTLMRHLDTEPKKFRELVRELSMLLCYEATRDLELVPDTVPTPNRVQLSLVLDPMLATGGTAEASVDILKRWGCERIKYLGLIAAPEGVKRLSAAHPDVPIHVGALDERLNDIGYIVPGLGDAGDRQFGTS